MSAALRPISLPLRLYAGQAAPAAVTPALQEAGNIVEQQVQPDMADDGSASGEMEKISRDLTMRRNREYWGEMLALFHTDE
ncbi:hypothetical protein [Burkholderia stagnalis]|uniref:hypothetical protein n=1 Tax=Burkholderia stagnalis TaxID=1503054 RepID=UPI000F5CBC67|nr:hypothetical protein [Burkholderia stagnalis]